MPGGGQPAPRVRERAQDRVQNGRAGEEGVVVAGKRRPVQQMREFLVSRGTGTVPRPRTRCSASAATSAACTAQDREAGLRGSPTSGGGWTRGTGCCPSCACRGAASDYPGPCHGSSPAQAPPATASSGPGLMAGVRLGLERGQHHGLGFRPGERPVAAPGLPGLRGFRPGWARLPGGGPGPFERWPGPWGELSGKVRGLAGAVGGPARAGSPGLVRGLRGPVGGLGRPAQGSGVAALAPGAACSGRRGERLGPGVPGVAPRRRVPRPPAHRGLTSLSRALRCHPRQRRARPGAIRLASRHPACCSRTR